MSWLSYRTEWVYLSRLSSDIYTEVELLGHIFSFSGKLHTIFHSGFTICIPIKSVPFSHLCQYLLFVVLLRIAFLTSVKRYLFVVFICISLMISDAEHLFMCPLAVCMSSLEKYEFRSSAHFFLTGFFFF